MISVVTLHSVPPLSSTVLSIFIKSCPPCVPPPKEYKRKIVEMAYPFRIPEKRTDTLLWINNVAERGCSSIFCWRAVPSNIINKVEGRTVDFWWIRVKPQSRYKSFGLSVHMLYLDSSVNERTHGREVAKLLYIHFFIQF